MTTCDFSRASSIDERPGAFRNYVIFLQTTNLWNTLGAMPSDTPSQRLLRLARSKGVLRPSDLDESGIARVYLTRLTADGQLEKTGRGLYRLADQSLGEQETLTTVATRAPQAVFCLLTALQFHGLTTQLSSQVWIAMPRGSHAPRMDYPPLKMIQYSGASHTEGVETHERDGVKIKVYGVAKTVADCFKHRNKIGLDVALEALKEARASKHIKVDELWRYATLCRVANVMRPYLEALG